METDLINHFNLRFVCVFSINGKYFGHLELEIVLAIAHWERTKFDRFVDPNVIEFFLRLKIHRICAGVPKFEKENLNFIVSMDKL